VEHLIKFEKTGIVHVAQRIQIGFQPKIALAGLDDRALEPAIARRSPARLASRTARMYRPIFCRSRLLSGSIARTSPSMIASAGRSLERRSVAAAARAPDTPRLPVEMSWTCDFEIPVRRAISRTE
jgi:hypothetical protein